MRAPQLKVVVVENEGRSRKLLVRQLRAAGCAVLNSFTDGWSAHDWIGDHREVEAAFLEIHRPEQDALAVLRALNGQVPIVITTAFPEHAVAAFDSGVVDFLLKPVTASRLERALKRLVHRAAPAAPRPAPVLHRYPVQAGEGVVFVDLHKTTYFEVEGEVVWAHAGGRMRTQWKTLNEVEAAFPTGLLRVHRHLLVRLEAVVGLRSTFGGRAMVRLAGGEEIEASRGGAPRLRERLGLG
jgi:two-component system LytT family response regulator/two-component system response regulator AlgR